MGFEAPLALLGLAAAAIPVIVHLMRRRDLPRVELPTVTLLRRAQVQSRRRMRLVDLLLLLARILFVLLLALAIAGPYATERVAWGDGRVASVAIVLDDSMSMARSTGGRSGIAAAAARARAAIEALPAGSEVAVVLAGRPARLLVPRTRDLDAAAARVARLPGTSARGTDLSGAVARAVRELGGAANDVRRVLVLSDFAAHARADDVRWPGRDVSLDVEAIGGERDANLAVVGAVAVPDPTVPGQASVAVELRGFTPAGTTVPSEVEIRLEREDRSLARARVSVAGGVGRATLHVPLPRDGDPTARVRIETSDVLRADDARGVLLRAPAAVRVLVVDGDPHATRAHDEVRFLARALELAPHAEGAISYQIVDPDTLAGRDLAGFDVVAIANAPAPAGRVARRLGEFVAEGGGLLITAGDRVEPRGWMDALGEVLPARLRAAVRSEPVTLAAPGQSSITDDAGIVPPGGAGLTSVSTTERLLLEPRADARTLLAFGDGGAALVIGRHRRGRVAMLATTVDDDWTDLPYRPGFLPLMVGLVRGLGPAGVVHAGSGGAARDEGSTAERAFEPGAPVMLPVPPGASRLIVIAPDGTETLFEGEDLEERVRFVPERAGAHRVQVAETGTEAARDVPRSAFVVAPPASESDLARAALPARLAANEAGGARRGAVVRRSLAPALFLAAGLLAAVEALLRLRRAPRTLPATA